MSCTGTCNVHGVLVRSVLLEAGGHAGAPSVAECGGPQDGPRVLRTLGLRCQAPRGEFQIRVPRPGMILLLHLFSSSNVDYYFLKVFRTFSLTCELCFYFYFYMRRLVEIYKSN